MNGPKPRPTWRKQLEGNPGKRPINQQEPQHAIPDASFDAIPPELIEDARAAAEWERVAPLLRKHQQITEADRASLIALCQEWSRYLVASKKIAKEGLITTSPNGYVMPTPYISIARQALASCAKLWAELGMTPSSRSRVKVMPAEDDAFSEFDAPPASAARESGSH